MKKNSFTLLTLLSAIPFYIVSLFIFLSIFSASVYAAEFTLVCKDGSRFTEADKARYEACQAAPDVQPNPPLNGSGGAGTTPVVSTKADCIKAGGTWENKYVGSTLQETCTPKASGAAGTSAETADIIASKAVQDCKGGPGVTLDESNCGIIKYINLAFDVVSGVVVLGVIANIIISGIMYSMAQGEPSAAAKAKGRIQQGAIALLLYFMLYGFIQWLIPGGAF